MMMMMTTMMIVVIAVVTMIPVMTHSRVLHRNTWRTPCHGSTPIRVDGEAEATQAPPTAEQIRRTLNILERKAEEVRHNVMRLKNVMIDERLGPEMGELLEQSQVPFSEYPIRQPLTVVEMPAVVNRTIFLLSRCIALLQRAIVNENLHEARNPLNGPLERIRDGARDMLCLALRTLSHGRNRSVDSLLSATEVAAVDAIAANYDRPMVDFIAHFGNAQRSWIDFVLLRNLGRDLEQLRSYYLRVISRI